MRSAAVIAILLASGIARGAQSPSDAAVAWLQEVASGKAETKPAEGTALSPEVSAEDLKSIRARLARLRLNLRPEQLRPQDLRTVAKREDGDLAAVLVSQITNFDSNSAQIHAVGLVKQGEEWLPAPLPSSFNSTGLSFRPGFPQRAKVLEDWMLSERADQLVRLKDDAFSLLTEEMRKFVTPAALREVAPAKLTGDFLTALAKHDLPGTLALLGGLEEPRPDNWDDIVQIVSSIMSKQEISHPLWRLLASPEAVRAVTAVDDKTANTLVCIVALDPGGDSAPRLWPRTVHLPVVRSAAGTWRVELNSELLEPATHATTREEKFEEAANRRAEAKRDAEFIEKFPAKLREALPTAAAETPRAAAESLVAALRAPVLADLCSRLDLGDDSKSFAFLMRMGELWRDVHRPSEGTAPLLLEVQESGDLACAFIQMVSGSRASDAEIEKIFLKRGDKGWLAIQGEPEPPLSDELAAFKKRLAESMAARQKEWWTGMVTRINGIAADSAPAEDLARRLVEETRKACAAGDAAAVLARVACFDDDTSTARLLRNAGYDLAARREGEILGVHRAGRWAAVSMHVPAPQGDDSADQYPLVVVVETPAGPRILADVDLYDPPSDGGTRSFLNRGVWERVSARLPEEARHELETIYEKHRTLSAADRGRQK